MSFHPRVYNPFLSALMVLGSIHGTCNIIFYI